MKKSVKALFLCLTLLSATTMVCADDILADIIGLGGKATYGMAVGSGRMAYNLARFTGKAGYFLCRNVAFKGAKLAFKGAVYFAKKAQEDKVFEPVAKAAREFGKKSAALFKLSHTLLRQKVVPAVSHENLVRQVAEFDKAAANYTQARRQLGVSDAAHDAAMAALGRTAHEVATDVLKAKARQMAGVPVDADSASLTRKPRLKRTKRVALLPG